MIGRAGDHSLRGPRRAKNALRADDLPDRLNSLICPTGKSVNWLSSPSRKNILLSASGKSLLQLPPSCPERGALRNVNNAGRDAVDAGSAGDEQRRPRTAKSCGPDASTPASSQRNSFPQATVTRKPDHRGEHEGNR
jgi:hypothetical protein